MENLVKLNSASEMVTERAQQTIDVLVQNFETRSKGSIGALKDAFQLQQAEMIVENDMLISFLKTDFDQVIGTILSPNMISL